MHADERSLSVVRVNLPNRGYDVRVGAGLLESLGERAREALGSERASETPAPPKSTERAARRVAPPGDAATRAFLAHDACLPSGLVDTAQQSLAAAGFDVSSAAIQASEERKSLDALADLLEAIAAAKLERSEPVVALGGGVVGDVAGFAACVYRRGVPVIQCPTTLLAMVDASVGGKTGVNLRVGGQLRKNMVGAFWQPSLVLCDVSALDSLPERHLRSGLAECVKHALIAASTPAKDRLGLSRDDELFEWTSAALPRALAREAGALVEFIARNVAVKASVVERDEREEAADDVGGRALLNLGHTFAHAIETLPGLTPVLDPALSNAQSQAQRSAAGLRQAPHPQPLSQRERGAEPALLHGEAVGLGLIAAAACAEALGLTEAALIERVREAASAAGLPTMIAGLPSDQELIDAMAHDKKQRAGARRLVLPTGLGTCRVVADPPEEAVAAGWSAIRAGQSQPG